MCGPADVPRHFDPLVDRATTEMLILDDIAAATAHSTLTTIRYQCLIIIIIFSVLHSQGLKISQSKNVWPEWLRWGLGNCERVGKAHCIETLICVADIVV